MEDSNIYTKIDFLNPQYEQTEKSIHYSDINDSFYAFSECEKNKSTENIIINDKFFEFCEHEQIFDKNKEIIINSNFNDNILNKEELKKQLRLKRNRESAKEGRLRKKIYIENLINKLNELQAQNSILLNIILNCRHCKEEFEKANEKNNKKKNNYILSNENSITKKPKLLFMTAIGILSIFNIFNIFLFNQPLQKIRNIRNLSFNDQSEIIINKIKSSNEEEVLYLHLAEYYSLTTREKVLGNNDLEEEINKNIKIYNNDTFNIDNMNQTNASKCVKCMMEIDKNSIKLGGDELTFYIVDKLLSKKFMNNYEDGIFPELNFEKENQKSNSFSKVFAIKCKIIGYSINNLYSEKIGSIS